MATLNQQRAARINGRLSRGPITPEGKARSSLNAITHGLNARLESTLLDGESPELFRELLDDFVARYQPADRVEAEQLQDMILARWQLLRLFKFEASLINLEQSRLRGHFDQPVPSRANRDGKLATAYHTLANGSSTPAQLLRHAAHLERIYKHASLEFDRLKRMRVTECEFEPAASEPQLLLPFAG
jgi:hypothetical protein